MAVNTYELQVFAAMRSGHHAIVHWLLCHFSGVTLFRNNVCGPEHSIYRNASDEFILLDEVRPQPKDCYVFNIEDHTIEQGAEVLRTRRAHLARGSSERVFRILVLRDLHNFIASRLRAYDFIGYPYEDHAELWASHAREFVGETEYLPGSVKISYNEWVGSELYRRRLSERLGLPFTDRGLQHVPKIGGGSSFDGTEYDGRGQEMAVLSRWHAYADDETFRRYTSDPERVELSRRIFGPPRRP